MPTHVLIVEGDTALSGRMRSALEQRGHTVEHTTDGRSALDLVKRRLPGVLVLAVELPGGQNGYLLVGKLKKDEALKTLPVIIVGNPEGFEAHRRLKNRADEYMARPLDLPKLVSAVARLSGSAEETPLVLEEEATVSGDPDLDLIDAAFDDSPEPPPARPVSPPKGALPEEDFSGLNAGEEGPTMVQLAPAPASEPDLPELSPSDLVTADEDDQARAFAAEVQAAQRELGEVPASVDDSGALDEVSRLRSELHAAEQLVGDLRDQHAQAEQREVELRTEVARRDGQLKALQSRLDQTVQERRRLEQAIQGGAQGDADEARRALEDELAAVRRDLELNRAHADGAERQLLDMRERAETAEAELQGLREQQESGTSPEEIESLRARVAELEAEAVKNRERVTRLYARLKGEERAREKARKAVAVASQLLAEQPAPESTTGSLEPVSADPEPSADEPAVA
jgi:CheY-like chemotaxis protein